MRFTERQDGRRLNIWRKCLHPVPAETPRYFHAPPCAQFQPEVINAAGSEQHKYFYTSANLVRSPMPCNGMQLTRCEAWHACFAFKQSLKPTWLDRCTSHVNFTNEDQDVRQFTPSAAFAVKHQGAASECGCGIWLMPLTYLIQLTSVQVAKSLEDNLKFLSEPGKAGSDL